MKINERNQKKSVTISKASNFNSNANTIRPFTGIESIRLKEIKIPESYQTWQHSSKEYLELMEYYNIHRKLDKPIIVEIRENQYYLKDNFLQYRVAKKLNKTWIRATMNISILQRKKN